MELDAEEAALGIGHGGDARHFAGADNVEAGGDLRNRVEVAHPDAGLLDAVQERIGRGDGELGDAVFAAFAFFDFAAEVMSE